jgi:hypothetical protein
MDITSMDPKTAQVAVELQLANIDDLLDGLYDEEEIPEGDRRVSFQLLRCDFQRQLHVLEGQALALRILKEEHDIHGAFTRLLDEERRAVTDHQLAMSIAGLAITEPRTENRADLKTSLCDTSTCNGDNQWDMTKELWQSAFKRNTTDLVSFNGIRTIKARYAKANASSKILGSEALTKCCACMETVPSTDTLTLNCKPEAHKYCRACLNDLFSSALVNTTLFPPRCCKLTITTRHMPCHPAKGVHQRVRPEDRRARDAKPNVVFARRMLRVHSHEGHQGSNRFMCVL